MHAFKAHLSARLCHLLKVKVRRRRIDHPKSLQWLKGRAESLVSETLYPERSEDPVYSLHRSFLHTAFLYIDLRNAIRWEDGPHIIRHWKLWLPRFVGTGCNNYSNEAVNLLANIVADFPCHIAYIAVHNRTVTCNENQAEESP